MKTRSKNITRGFTLLELLVAMAITTVIISVLVYVTSLALETWNRSRAEIRAAQQAKSMIDTMAKDFESFVSRKGNDFEWLHANSTPPTGPNGIISPNALDLIFFSAATDRYNGQVGPSFPGNKGDVSAVGYQMSYQDPINGASDNALKTFVLYRKILNPDATFTNVLGKTNLKTAFDAVGGVTNQSSNFICENLYQFSITLHLSYTVGTTTNTIRIPIGQGASSVDNLSIKGTGITDNAGDVIAGMAVNGAIIKSARVSAVEISLTVLSDFGIQQMRKRTLSDAELSAFIAKHSYQYSKLVPLPGS
jgi:prepilin-type N-terminal cleavage/methylation domain-containing protein